MNESFLRGHFKVPQIQVATLGAHSQSGGQSGMPLQTGDPAVEGAGGSVEMVGGQGANERFLETLEETTELNAPQLADRRWKYILQRMESQNTLNASPD